MKGWGTVWFWIGYGRSWFGNWSEGGTYILVFREDTVVEMNRLMMHYRYLRTLKVHCRLVETKMMIYASRTN